MIQALQSFTVRVSKRMFGSWDRRKVMSSKNRFLRDLYPDFIAPAKFQNIKPKF
jgi:hypothetical protein